MKKKIAKTLVFTLVAILVAGCSVSPGSDSGGGSSNSSFPKLRKEIYYEANGTPTHYVIYYTNATLNGKSYNVEITYNPADVIISYWIDGFPQAGNGEWRGYKGGLMPPFFYFSSYHYPACSCGIKSINFP